MALQRKIQKHAMDGQAARLKQAEGAPSRKPSSGSCRADSILSFFHLYSTFCQEDLRSLFSRPSDLQDAASPMGLPRGWHGGNTDSVHETDTVGIVIPDGYRHDVLVA